MSATGKFHEAMKVALLKDGWTITADPLFFRFGGVDAYIDLAAERIIAAERNGYAIAVEIKSFLGASAISEFHTALGQFMNYRAILRRKDPQRRLFLAIPSNIFSEFFQLKFIQVIIQDYQLSLVIYDFELEEILQWQT